jgi:hypothetical protein
MESVKDYDRLLGTRRDLLGDPLCVDVFTWLRPIYLRPKSSSVGSFTSKITELVTLIEPAVKSEEGVRASVHSLSKLVSAPIGAEYQKTFKAIKRPKSSLFGTFVSLAYARAVLLLAATAGEASRVVPCFKDILASPRKFEKGLSTQKKLDERFVGHLVTLAEIEAQLDPYFHKVLRRSADAFVETHRPDRESKNPLHDPEAGLELLGSTHQSSWWWLPTGVAFALTIWDQEVV